MKRIIRISETVPSTLFQDDEGKNNHVDGKGRIQNLEVPLEFGMARAFWLELLGETGHL